MKTSYRNVEVASPIGARTELTGAASKLLADLEARVYLEPKGCWLVGAPRARYSLLVPVDWSQHPERLRGVSDHAVAELERYGLVECGAWEDAPAYSYRSHSDRSHAKPIKLTPLGRQRLARVTAERAA